MAQKPTIPEQDTRQLLQERFSGDTEALTLLSGGEWSQAYSFVHQQQKYVLRWCHSAETFEKDAFASRFSSEAMPVPKIMDTGIQFDTYFAISEFAQGQFIDTLPSAELDQTLPALFKLFDALRNADLSQTTGYGGWDKNGVGDHTSWKGYLLDVRSEDDVSRSDGWYADLAKSSVGTKVFDQLYARLEALVDQCPEERALIHSDLLHYNLLVADAKISAVIDWQCSLFGDALYDVAWFIYYTPWYPHFATVQPGQKLRAHFEAATGDYATLNARLLCYQLHIGLGSMAYNAFKKDWKAVQEVADYTLRISDQSAHL